MANAYQAELTVAREAARLAADAIMELYAAFVAIPDAPADVSTEADKRSQELILQRLVQSFPEDAYCAEEAEAFPANLRREGPRLWIVDPIDGSRGFAKKLGEFSVMIGLAVNGEPQVGVVLEPARQRETWAVRGQGCWRADAGGAAAPCRVSPMTAWDLAVLVRSHSEKNPDLPALNAVGRQVFTYSAGVKLALVARGEADVYVSTYEGFNAWDVCAGQLLVEEAGGRVTDVRGEAIRYASDGGGKIHGTVASNGLLHPTALRLLYRP